GGALRVHLTGEGKERLRQVVELEGALAVPVAGRSIGFLDQALEDVREDASTEGAVRVHAEPQQEIFGRIHPLALIRQDPGPPDARVEERRAQLEGGVHVFQRRAGATSPTADSRLARCCCTFCSVAAISL